MLRAVARKASVATRGFIRARAPAVTGVSTRQMTSGGPDITAENFDEEWAEFFKKPDIDPWELREAMNSMHGMDLVPDPIVMREALRACRRVNDHSLAIRYMEAVKYKSQFNPKIWPYIMQEIKPTLDELGISTLEELGYDVPELALEDTEDWHGPDDPPTK